MSKVFQDELRVLQGKGRRIIVNMGGSVLGEMRGAVAEALGTGGYGQRRSLERHVRHSPLKAGPRNGALSL